MFHKGIQLNLACHIILLGCLQQGFEGLVMVTMIRLVTNNHNIISSYDYLFYLAKTFI